MKQTINSWHKYEVKDSSRGYWTIFFRANFDEAKKNPITTSGSEGYYHVDWHYYVLFGCTAKMEKLTEKAIDKLVNAEGVYGWTFNWDAHEDDMTMDRLALCAPRPDMFLKDYLDRVLGALTSACHGNVIENSLEK